MDYLLYLKLRCWAKRKTQRAKSGTLKYWRRLESRKHVFATEANGKMIELYQYIDFARSLRNEYVKVIGESSPFDGNEVYWASRLGKSSFMSKTQTALLRAQKGRCALCKGLFMDEDILEIDHINPFAKGGKRSINNLQLFHRHCHDQKDSLFGIKDPLLY